jgi:hypothetical protein
MSLQAARQSLINLLAAPLAVQDDLGAAWALALRADHFLSTSQRAHSSGEQANPQLRQELER